MENMSITPLGAAIVEAMPDERKMDRIQRAFKRNNQCPVSAIFSADQIRKYYGGKIKPTGTRGVKAQSTST
jgi:hypothetical protein